MPEFRNFIVALLRKRIFVLFIFLGLAGISLQLTISAFAPLQVYYWGLIFVGFVWSAFLVYRDLALAYQKLLVSTSVKDIPKSELSIAFVHGQEYTYSISDPYDGSSYQITRMQNAKGMKCHFDERGVFFVNDKVYYAMAKGSLEINIRLQNSGDLPLDVLSIDLDDNLDLNHLRFFHEGVFHHGSGLQCPFHLESEELVVLQIKYKISASKGSSDALFAADFRALPHSILYKISVETLDANRERRSYISELKTQSKPLMDLYAKQWREYDQLEYLVLSGYRLINDA